ncbi:MAG: hypothetical protein AB8G22_22085 [Saprospiraceae bacterium]
MQAINITNTTNSLLQSFAHTVNLKSYRKLWNVEIEVKLTKADEVAIHRELGL